MLDIAAYFERLGMPRDTVPEYTYDFLRELQYRQVTTVPYENLDVLEGKPISLAPDALFDKMVTRRRGGWCFESNALFSYVLKQLGFEVKDYFARFLYGETTIPARRHHVLAVSCREGLYLCDVGVGRRAPRYPVKIEEGLIQEQLGEQYVFERDSFLGWILMEIRGGERRRLFSFTTEEQLMVDFAAMSFYCEKHPDSPFNKTMMVSLKTEHGRKTIRDREFREFYDDEVLRIESDLSDQRRKELLANEFGL